MEREIGATGGEGPSYEDVLCLIRAKLLTILNSPDTQPSDTELARNRLGSLDVKVWTQRQGGDPVNIIDALAASSATGLYFETVIDPKKGNVEYDWLALALEWGIVDASDDEPQGRGGLITRIIVYPTHVLTGEPPSEVTH